MLTDRVVQGPAYLTVCDSRNYQEKEIAGEIMSKLEQVIVVMKLEILGWMKIQEKPVEEIIILKCLK